MTRKIDINLLLLGGMEVDLGRLDLNGFNTQLRVHELSQGLVIEILEMLFFDGNSSWNYYFLFFVIKNMN